jgi:hypothetical protein
MREEISRAKNKDIYDAAKENEKGICRTVSVVSSPPKTTMAHFSGGGRQNPIIPELVLQLHFAIIVLY